MALKLFRLTLGSVEKFAVANDEEEMYEKRAEVEPTFAFTPVEITELVIPGYIIEVHVENEQEEVETPVVYSDMDLLSTEQPAIYSDIPYDVPQESEQTPVSPEWVAEATKAQLTQFLEGLGVDVKTKMNLSELRELALQHV